MSNDEKLIVEQVHMYPKENARLHHTECFQIVHQEPPQVVLRRGQPFHIVIRFLGRRGFEPTKDEINLIFSFGPDPPRKGIKVVIPVVDKQAPEDLKDWHAKVLGRDANSVNIEIRSPADIAIGQWALQVETKYKGHTKSEAKIFKYQDIIYFLFNPWIKDDQVYMADERLLDEYVLNDIGKIWVGPFKMSRGREWVFGQFDEVVLPATMLMLDRTHLAPDKRGNPVYLTRAISKLVNSNDDQGVLQGRWDGEYSDGTAPAAWTGSVPILEEYLDTGREVRYGQCWVFAGVVTTVCRALGIPSRVVSNLVSAHDANSSLTIDRYYKANNEEYDYDPNNFEGEDSIWNYHVWNDVWMLRPDLPKGYGGWQAIDATPQETSDGVYQCGPASLEAVRCGAVGLNYDVSFLLASVNADVVRWKEDDSEFGFSKIETNQYHVGREILTKKPWIFDPNGDRDREDITSLYKNQEGSKAERLTLLNGVRNTERAKRFFNLPTKSREDIEFELVDIEHVNIGEKFSVVVNINNKSDKNRTVQASLSAASIYYTGVKAHVIKKATGDFKVGGKSKELLRLVVRPEDYMEKLVEYCNMKIYAIATVLDTKETWAEEDDFQVLKPNLDIKLEDEDMFAGKPCTVSFSFKNPLKKTLTNCKFRYEGPGLIKSTAITYRNVSPEESVKVEHRFTPMKHGMYRLVAVFSSKELVDITGSAAFDVLKTEE